MSHSHAKDLAQTMPEADRGRSLCRHIREHSLPVSQPALYESLHMLLSAADPLRQDMEESLDQLKEAFLQVMYDILEKNGITLLERLVIGLSGNVLAVADRSHPQAEAVDALLAAEPMLATVMRQIAADTLMLESLTALGQAFAAYRDALEARNSDAVESYQLCLKGPLSHFYYA